MATMTRQNYSHLTQPYFTIYVVNMRDKPLAVKYYWK